MKSDVVLFIYNYVKPVFLGIGELAEIRKQESNPKNHAYLEK